MNVWAERRYGLFLVWKRIFRHHDIHLLKKKANGLVLTIFARNKSGSKKSYGARQLLFTSNDQTTIVTEPFGLT